MTGPDLLLFINVVPPNGADCHPSAPLCSCAEGITLLWLQEVRDRHDGGINIEDTEPPGKRRSVDF